MWRRLLAIGALIIASLQGCGALNEETRPPVLDVAEGPVVEGKFDKVLIIVLENEDYAAATHNEILRGIAKRGVLLTNFHGLFHPSYSNYLAMISGRSIPTNMDIQRDIAGPTIADRLDAAGRQLTWKNYAEGYPPGGTQGCFIDSGSGSYARKHVPFLSFTSIRQSHCDRVVPSDQLWKDLADDKLPSYSFYSPDLNHDGHDSGLTTAAAWLAGFLDELGKYGQSANGPLRRTLLVVTFDESGRQEYNSNHIYTVLLGDVILSPGATLGTYLTHFDVLRLIEDNFALDPLDEGDGRATGIPDCIFESSNPPPCVKQL